MNPTDDRYSVFSVLLTFPFHLCVCMSADQVIEMGIWRSIKLLQILILHLREDVDINTEVVPLLHKTDSH